MVRAAPLAALPAYAALLGAPTNFEAAHNSHGFDAAQWALPLVGASAQLRNTCAR